MASGSHPTTCPTCQGRGQIIRSEGFFRISSTCPHCSGSGTIITDPCQACKGQGRVRERHKVRVRIPAGVDTGSRLRLMREGEAGLRDGPRGDLYIVIHVKPNDLSNVMAMTYIFAFLFLLYRQPWETKLKHPLWMDPAT